MSQRDAARLRIPPQSVHAEQSVLGGLMLDPDAVNRVGDRLSANDFYRRDHQLIYSAILELADAGKPFDAVTIGEWFEAQGMGEMVGGGAYLVELASTTPSAANIKAYADIVRDKSLLRKLIGVGTDIVNDGFQPDGRESEELLSAAESALLALSKQAGDMAEAEPGKRGLMRAVLEMDRRREAGGGLLGIESSIDELDRLILGLQPTDLVILAARPSMGKTAMMGQMRRHAARLGKRPYTVSLEMSAEQIYMRDIAAEARVNLRHVQIPSTAEDEDWPRMEAAIQRMAQWAWWLDDQSAMTVEQICARARRAKMQHDTGIIFIDYLQFITPPSTQQNGAAAIQHITRALKGLAKELKVPIVLLSQLNRGLESRTNKRPMMSDLRESGAIEQDADVILFLHREGYYKAHEWPKDDPRHRIGEIIVGKCRNGELGVAHCRVSLEYQSFDNLSYDEIPEDYHDTSNNDNKRGGSGGRSGAGFSADGHGGSGSQGKRR